MRFHLIPALAVISTNSIGVEAGWKVAPTAFDFKGAKYEAARRKNRTVNFIMEMIEASRLLPL